MAQAIAPRPSSTPEVTDTPRPTDGSADVITVRTNDGTGGKILTIDARTGQTLRTVPDGAVTADGRSVYWTEPANGARQTVVHLMEIATGTEVRSLTVDGDLRPAGNSETFSPLAADGRLSRDGAHLALMSAPNKVNGEWVTRLAVVNTASGAVESATELRAQTTYGFIAFGPGARTFFVEQYGEGGTRTRVFDVATAKLADAAGDGLTTTGFRTAAVLSRDGRRLYRVDAGSPTTNCRSNDPPSCIRNGKPPYLVAIDLEARRAKALPLPASQTSDDFEKYMLWSLTITHDGTTLYAANPAVGAIDEIDAGTLTLRRSGAITVARAGHSFLDGVTRFFFPVADAKRYLVGGAVLSADGRTLYAAAHDGVAVVDIASLTSRAVWQPAHQFDTMRLSPDGRRLYAAAAGKLVTIDTTTGASLGEIKAPNVAAILRIDAGR